MSAEFSRDGVKFQYPENWELETEDLEEGWTISVFSPTTAFLVVSYCPDVDDPAEIADAALEGLKDSYPGLEATETVENLAGQPGIGFDVNFIHLDLTNVSWIRAIPWEIGSLLVLAQCCDDELEENGVVLQAILKSFQLEE